jgi:hypothetical protein
MSVLEGFDVVFLLSSRFLRDFITGVEQKYKEVVEGALEMVRDLPGDREEVVEETLANFFLPVPRLLFATKNPAYPSGDFPCPPAAAGLLRRLQAHRDLGERDGTRSNPHRLTFLRPDFFDMDRPVPMTFEAGRVRIALEGKVFLGRRFSRSRAENAEDTFSMDLLYEPVSLPVGQSLVGLTSYISNGAATSPLPPAGSPVYVKTVCLETDAEGNCLRSKFVLPAAGDFPVDTCDQTEQARGEERVRHVQPFRGQVGEQIFVSDTAPAPRFEVRLQLTSGMQLVPVLVDLANAEQVVAEGVGGRTVMQLVGIENLTVRIDGDLNPFSEAEMKAICRSLVKVHPFSPFARPDSIPDAARRAQILRMLGLFGNLDFLFFLQTFQLSFNPRIEAGEDFVRSDSNLVQFTGIKVLPDPGGIIVLAGDLAGSDPGNITVLADFSNGLDLTFGLSQTFLENVLLRPLRAGVKKTLECNDKINAANVEVVFANPDAAHPRGFIEIEATGNGTKPDAVWWVDVDFDFTVRFPLALDLQHAVVRQTFFLDADGQVVDPEDDPEATPVEFPVNAYGERIPLEVLDTLGIRAPAFTTADPNQNPLCFLGYCDPRKLDPPAVYCTAPATPPPVVNAAGTQIPPPAGVDPDPTCHSQVDFVDPVVHAKEIVFRPPDEDELDIAADADVGFFGFIQMLLISVIGLALAIVALPIGLVVLPISPDSASNVFNFAKQQASLILVTFVLLFGLEEDVLPKEEVASKAASRMPTVNPTLDLVVDLVSYAEDVEIQEGALLVRNRTIVEVQDDMSGLEAIGA